MQKIEEIQQLSGKQQVEQSFLLAKKDCSFVKLLHKLELDDHEGMKYTSKLQDVLNELEHCNSCEGLHLCKNSFRGHAKIVERKEENLYFSYGPCRYQQDYLNILKMRDAQAHKVFQARMKDIDMTGDKKRMEVIKWIDHFYSTYDSSKDMKGLYLHGSFGSGKTFLLSALLHELEITKHVSILIVYFPEVLRMLKDDWELYEVKIKQYQTVDLLLLDDIGSEKVTEWGRDEVLGTILQYRMDHSLPTFFTSNRNLKELEKYLADTGRTIDTVQSRRIIERIKQQAFVMELTSENRRG